MVRAPSSTEPPSIATMIMMMTVVLIALSAWCGAASRGDGGREQGGGEGRAKDGGRARTRQGIIEWEGKVREGQGDKGREEEEGKVGTAECKGRGGVEARKRA